MWISGVSLYSIMASTPLSRLTHHPVRSPTRLHGGTHSVDFRHFETTLAQRTAACQRLLEESQSPRHTPSLRHRDIAAVVCKLAFTSSNEGPDL